MFAPRNAAAQFAALVASTGAGYDLSPTTFSPDGRIFQVEYATKAVENAGTVVGMKCKDGVVLGVEKVMLSKMLLPMVMLLMMSKIMLAKMMLAKMMLAKLVMLKMPSKKVVERKSVRVVKNALLIIFSN